MPELILEHRFDTERKRHYLNDEVSVLHCHHYSTLFSQLAIDARDIVNGEKIMKEVSGSVFADVLNKYYRKHNIVSPEDRLDIACKMYSACGLGVMKVLSFSAEGGEVEMPHSHVDEGWLKKWGKANTPVNFLGAGFIAAMFAATFGGSPEKYKVAETQSIVGGASVSKFKVTN